MRNERESEKVLAVYCEITVLPPAAQFRYLRLGVVALFGRETRFVNGGELPGLAFACWSPALDDYNRHHPSASNRSGVRFLSSAKPISSRGPREAPAGDSGTGSLPSSISRARRPTKGRR